MLGLIRRQVFPLLLEPFPEGLPGVLLGGVLLSPLLLFGPLRNILLRKRLNLLDKAAGTDRNLKRRLLGFEFCCLDLDLKRMYRQGFTVRRLFPPNQLATLMLLNGYMVDWWKFD